MKAIFRKSRVACPLVIFVLLPALTRAETAVQAWVQGYSGSGAAAVAVDGSTNVIVTGSASGYYATIKYSTAGVPLWTNRYVGPVNGGAIPTSVAVDGVNDVIVTGGSVGSGTGSDYATVKYSEAGMPLWTNRYNGLVSNSDDQARDVVVDGNNNVIVTGYSGTSSSADYLTIKYSDTGVPLSTNRYNGPGNSSDCAYAVAVDGNNNVIVTGFSTGLGGSTDYLTIKYSDAGVPLWTNRYHGPGASQNQARAVAVDGSNNVIVTGFSAGSGSSDDYATLKYSSAGVPLWTNRYNGPNNGTDWAKAVIVDGSNNVVVTGYSKGIGSGDDYATIKYSSVGVPLWTNRYSGPGTSTDWASAVAADASGNVVVTGVSGTDIATIKYSSAGVPLWTNCCKGPYGEPPASIPSCALAVERSGEVIVAGSSGRWSSYDYTTIKYSFPLLVTDVKFTNDSIQMLVDNLQAGTLVIEAATNLWELTNWAPVFTNTAPTNVLFYTDPDASNAPTRFYRAFQFP